MATQITVAVGANGEVLAAASMRQGARADRLDTEATLKQSKQAAFEAADDDAPGRDNPKDKYGKSSDPAAHARKKTQMPTGQFAGVQIQYTHHRLLNLPWDELRDAKYMDISVRPISSDGVIAEPVTIELTRNLVTDMFCVPIPDGLAKEEYQETGDTGYRFVPWWPQDPNWQWGFNAARFIYAVDPIRNCAVESGAVFTRNGFVWMRIPLLYTPEIVGQYALDPRNSSAIFNPYYIASDPEENFRQPEPIGFPADSKNYNVTINGRTRSDVNVTGWFDHDKDPVHEVFLLPYTGETTFLLVIFTDYLIKTRSLISQVSINKSELNGDIFAGVETLECTDVSWERFKPTHIIPDGYEFPETQQDGWEDGGYQPNVLSQITEKGSNKIQTIKLYKIVNGEMTEIEDIPQQLRDRASNLSYNFNGSAFRVDGKPAWRQSSNKRVRKSYFGSSFGGVEDEVFTERTTVETTDWRMWWPACGWTSSKELFELLVERKYLGSKTEERSIAKGYGMGDLSTGNHFNSPYLLSDLFGFYDDCYFTPMVYQYLKGDAECSKLYERINQSITVKPEYFVDTTSAATFGTVVFAKDMPSTIDVSYTGEYLGIEDVPGLKNATHMCWNWNRPDHCWDELTALGFSQALLGPRPDKPSDQ